MFRPNLKCVVVKSTKNDLYGMPQPGQRRSEGFAIIKLDVQNQKTNVRADTSASRGNANELEADAKFLLTATTVAEIDDLIEYGGMVFRVMSLFPRHNLRGVLDHFEAGCAYWSRA